LKVKGLPETRENLLNTGNLLRNTFGADVLAKRTIAKLQPDALYCIDSIRHPAEVAALRQHGLQLVGVICDSQIRFERLKARGRVGDVADLEAFRRIEQLELANPDPLGQQLGLVLKECDVTLQNDATLEDLEREISTKLSALINTNGKKE